MKLEVMIRFLLLLLLLVQLAEATEIEVPYFRLERNRGMAGLPLVEKRNFYLPKEMVENVKAGDRVSLKESVTGQTVGSAVVSSYYIGLFGEIRFWEDRFRSLKSYLWYFYNLPFDSEYFARVKLRDLKLHNVSPTPLSSAFSRQNLPFVKTVGRSDLSRLKQGEALFIYVSQDPEKAQRDRSSFFKSFMSYPFDTSFARGKNGGYHIDVLNIQNFIRASSFVWEEKQQILAKILKVDKHRKVVVACQHERSKDCSMALTYLRYLGFKSLHWYREGLYGWQGLRVVVPQSSQLIPIVDKKEVEQLRKSPHILLDLRRYENFKKWRVSDAKHIEVKQSRFDGEPFKVSEQPSIIGKEPSLLTDLDLPSLGWKQGMSIILYGADQSKWSAYFAAIELKTLGYKKVFLYRNGFWDWISKGGDVYIAKEVKEEILGKEELLF